MKKRMAITAAGLTLAIAGGAWAGSASTSVNISLQVEKFAEWSDASPIIVETDWPGPIDKADQTRRVSKPLVLYTNTDTLIVVKLGLNGGVLTHGSQTLATAYKITGSVANPDSMFKDASVFFGSGNSYTVAYQEGTGAYPVNLEVEARSPANAAPEEGTYTCSVCLTATW